MNDGVTLKWKKMGIFGIEYDKFNWFLIFSTNISWLWSMVQQFQCFKKIKESQR